MTEQEFHNLVKNCPFGMLLWNEKGVYHLNTVNTTEPYLILGRSGEHYNDIKVTIENYSEYYVKVKNPEIAFAVMSMKEELLEEIKFRLGNF